MLLEYSKCGFGLVGVVVKYVRCGCEVFLVECDRYSCGAWLWGVLGVIVLRGCGVC